MGSASVPDFIVHDRNDSVGVVVVEDVQAGAELTGWIMDGDDTLVIRTLDAIPLGHKLALRDLASGETVVKYGHDIGKATATVPKGAHLHVHNTKTKRW